MLAIVMFNIENIIQAIAGIYTQFKTTIETITGTNAQTIIHIIHISRIVI